MAILQPNITVPNNPSFSFLKAYGRATILFPRMKLGDSDAEPFIKMLAMEFVDASKARKLPIGETGIQFRNSSGEPMDARAFFQFLVDSHRLMHGENYPISNERVDFLKTLFSFEGDTLHLRIYLAQQISDFLQGYVLTMAFARQFGSLQEPPLP